jgi:hypothetical protein
VPGLDAAAQTLLSTMSALRLTQLQLQEEQGDDWWLHPPWNPHKSRPSILDMQRVMRQQGEEIKQGMADWLRTQGKAPPAGGQSIAM